jgi:hypothetical protein
MYGVDIGLLLVLRPIVWGELGVSGTGANPKRVVVSVLAS